MPRVDLDTLALAPNRRASTKPPTCAYEDARHATRELNRQTGAPFRPPSSFLVGSYRLTL
jgi:hypothetical protein